MITQILLNCTHVPPEAYFTCSRVFLLSSNLRSLMDAGGEPHDDSDEVVKGKSEPTGRRHEIQSAVSCSRLTLDSAIGLDCGLNSY